MAIIRIMSSSNSSNANRVSAYAIRRWERDFMYVCVYTYNACIYTYTILCLPSSLSSSLSSLLDSFRSFSAPYRFSFVAGKPKRQLSAAIASRRFSIFVLILRSRMDVRKASRESRREKL